MPSLKEDGSLGTGQLLGDIYNLLSHAEIKPALHLLEEPLGYCFWPRDLTPFLLVPSFFLVLLRSDLP